MSVPIPDHGTDRVALLDQVRAAAEGDADWHGGRTFSLVYHHSDEHHAFLEKVVGAFLSTNALNPIAFQSLRRFEAEVVRMSAWLLGGDDAVAGTMSSGGTESILLAVKTYRDRARAESRLDEGGPPNLVLPVTAHPAFLKACHLLDVEPRIAPLCDDLRVDVGAVAEPDRRADHRRGRFGPELPARRRRPDPRARLVGHRAERRVSRRRLPRWLPAARGSSGSAARSRRGTCASPV